MVSQYAGWVHLDNFSVYAFHNANLLPLTKARLMRLNLEEIFHKQVAAYLNAALPKEAFWTTFPAGGGGLMRGAQLKAMGLKSGVPDIMVLHNSVAFFIELKAPKGVLSDTQKEVFEAIQLAGGKAYLARTLDHIEEILKFQNIAPRCTLSAAGKMLDTSGARIASGVSRFIRPAQRGPSRAALRNSALYQGPIKK